MVKKRGKRDGAVLKASSSAFLGLNPMRDSLSFNLLKIIFLIIIILITKR
jgi:hypothetical protein